ncbi:hypothetical protein ACFSJS_24080 [Streptomyces desertarenae]|uniref:Uncharacterized protein n=1 Tax=Streptomyces desertarenae TaxID=2666184 RepID=A0ABW4PR04_9ACTN
MQSPLPRRSAPLAPPPRGVPPSAPHPWDRCAPEGPRTARDAHGRVRALAAGTAAAVLVLAAATTATAADGAGTGPADGGITLSPDGGAGGASVGVRAVCAPGGRGGVVSSPAFERTVGLHRAEGGPARERRAVATVRPDLDAGRSYPVVAVCGTGEMLSTSFVHTGVRASARAGAVDLLPPAPVVGGGVALAALAGGLLVLRRAGRRRERERLAAWVRRVRTAEAEQEAERGSTRM